MNIKIITIAREEQTTKIETNYRKKVPIHKGRRQGGSLNQILFNLNEIIKEIQTAGNGYRRGKRDIKIRYYAGDLVLMS